MEISKSEHICTAQKIVLSAQGIRKAFDGQVVLDGVSLELGIGEVVLLKGENASGKTTLLNILTGNLEPDSGELHVSINGSCEQFAWPRSWWKELNPFDHFTPERLAWEGVGRVWQDIRLFPTMTTLENVAVASPHQSGENPALSFALPLVKREEKTNLAQSAEWLTRLGLDNRLDSSCDKISLGQMKRVAIARAIQAGAKVLFLDEPLSGLDNNGVNEVMSYLENLVKQAAITLVIVEHVNNIPTIMKLAHTVWTLQDGTLSSTRADEYDLSEDHSRHDLQGLISSVTGDNGTITNHDLPSGAMLTTVQSHLHEDSSVVFEAEGLVIKRGLRTVIDGFSIQLKRGQLAILEAPNGWGKSSLLDAIAGINDLEAGLLRLKGTDITALPTYQRIKSGLAYLRSSQQVFSSLSVKEHRQLTKNSNCLFRGTLNDMSKGSFLSGGEKQKILIEMLPDADVYLFDEPLIGLDQESIEDMYKLIRQLVAKGKAILITIPACSFKKEITT